MNAEVLTAYFTSDTADAERGFNIVEKRVDDLEKRFRSAADSFQNIFKNVGKGVELPSPVKADKIDAEMRRAQAVISRYQKQTEAGERSLSALIDRETERQQRSRSSNMQKGVRDALNELKKLEREEATSAKTTQSIFTQVLGGSFFGSLGANAVAFFTRELSALPGKVGDVIDQAVDVAATRQNAFKGLASIAEFKGIDSQSVQSAVQGLRLVKAGIVDTASASNPLKSLLQTNFTLDESIQLLERFSDTAAFGKQAGIDYSRAIESVGEALKNNNPLLLDNAGLSKNLSVIMKDMGKSEQDAGNLASDASARHAALAGILKETTSEVGNADKLINTYSGSTAALDQAQKNLYATIGDLIIQSPQMLEANKVLTEQITGYTTEIQRADSETAKFTQQAIANYAQLKASAIARIGAIVEFSKFALNTLAAFGGSIVVVFAAPIETIINGIQLAVTQTHNQIVHLLNSVTDLARSMPALGTVMPVFDNLAKIPHFEIWDTGLKDFYSVTKGITDNTNKFLATGDVALKKFRQLRSEADAIESRVRNAGNPVQNIPGYTYTDPNKSEGSAASGGKGKRRTAISKDDRTFRDLQEFTKSMGFTPGSSTGGGHNEGSLHYSGKALDIRTKDKTPQQIAEFIAAALEKGFRIVDERVRPKPGSKWTGEHLHAEINPSRESFLNPKLSYGNVPIDYLRKLDANRFNKARNFNPEDVNKFKEKQFDENLEQLKEKRLRDLMKLWKDAGLVPTGDLAKEFQKLLFEDAKKAGDAETAAGLSVQSVIDSYRSSADEKRFANAKPINSMNDTVSSNITARLTDSEQYVENLRESLGLRSRNADELTRMQKLIRDQINHDEIVKVLLEDQQLTIKETVETLSVENDLIRQRNTSYEAGLEFLKSETDQRRVLKDIERDLMVLRGQNSDPDFIKNRRDISAGDRQLGYEREITGLNDDIANYDRLQTYEIEIAKLREVLQLRDAETSKIIEGNRTIQDRMNLQLAQLPGYRTQIKDFFGNLPTAIGGVFDTAAKQWDGTFKGLLNSMKLSFAQMLSDLASQLLRSAVIKLVSQLFGSLLGGIGGSIGGGGLSVGSDIGGAAGGGWAGFFGGAAIGAFVPAKSGGHLALVGEGGHNEFILSTDPRHQARTSALLGEFFKQTNFIPKFAAGGQISPFSTSDIYMPGYGSFDQMNGGGRTVDRAGGGNAINNINVSQTIHAPRGTIAPKSAKQAAEAATSSISRMLKDKNG